MAGRPPGLRSIVSALAKLSPAEIKRLISSAPHLDKVQRLERERDGHIKALKKLDRQIAKLSGGNGHAAPAAKPGRKRRSWKLSAETRRKMSEAAKRRYAKTKGAASAEAKPKAKRRAFSAETRQKMAEAQRKRWAKVKGAAQPT